MSESDHDAEERPEWTSISVTRSQKQVLDGEKPSDASMGEFLVACVDDDAQLGPAVDVELDAERVADALADRLDGGGGPGLSDARAAQMTEVLDSVQKAVKENSQLVSRMMRQLDDMQGSP